MRRPKTEALRLVLAVGLKRRGVGIIKKRSGLWRCNEGGLCPYAPLGIQQPQLSLCDLARKKFFQMHGMEKCKCFSWWYRLLLTGTNACRLASCPQGWINTTSTLEFWTNLTSAADISEDPAYLRQLPSLPWRRVQIFQRYDRLFVCRRVHYTDVS